MAPGLSHRGAPLGVGAVPHNPQCPLRHLRLLNHHLGHLWHVDVLPLGAPAQRVHRRVGRREPALHLGGVNAVEEQAVDGDVARRPLRGAAPSLWDRRFPPLDSALQALVCARFPSRADGCDSRRSPGSGLRASRASSSGSRFRD
eukprot:6193844-Pleurochrysis_carterae.AAC.1